jgi:hypothetical protein
MLNSYIALENYRQISGFYVKKAAYGYAVPSLAEDVLP